MEMLEQTKRGLGTVVRLDFEYEKKDGKFNLYERGGTCYLTRDLSGEIRANGSLPNQELDLLFPVAQINDNSGSIEDLTKKAIDFYLKLNRTPARPFEFSLKEIGSEKCLTGIAESEGNCDLSLKRIAFDR